MHLVTPTILCNLVNCSLKNKRLLVSIFVITHKFLFSLISVLYQLLICCVVVEGASSFMQC